MRQDRRTDKREEFRQFRLLLGARERHNAERHLSAKAVFEKLNALPARDRAGARWVMSWATLESVCALRAWPKPVPGAAMTLLGLPIDLDHTAAGVELRPGGRVTTGDATWSGAVPLL